MSEEGLAAYLWYIIPGVFGLTPFLLKYTELSTLVNNTGFSVFVILLFYVFGYVIHIFYRILYHFLVYGKRESVDFFKNEIERMVSEKNLDVKRLKVWNFNDPKKVDLLYNYVIFSNPKLKDYITAIRRKSFYLSGHYTILLAIGMGLAVSIYFNLKLLIIIAYFIIFLILFTDSCLLQKNMNAHEKFLIQHELERALKDKLNVFPNNKK